MQLFILIVINVFMGALFYLIISLKLEKTASEFHEKKLRKEMDDIIKEFNSAAERNISILENRINVMKKMLERSGDLKRLDMIVSEDMPDEEKPRGIDFPAREGGSGFMNGAEEREISITKKKEMAAVSREQADLKKSLLILFRNVIDMMYDMKNGMMAFLMKRKTVHHVPDAAKPGDEAGRPFQVSNDDPHSLIRKEMSGFEEILSRNQKAVPVEEKVTDNYLDKEDDKGPLLDEEEMTRLFLETEDVYSLVADLYGMGYSMEKIAHFSGMPAGEIKLILNLRRT